MPAPRILRHPRLSLRSFSTAGGLRSRTLITAPRIRPIARVPLPIACQQRRTAAGPASAGGANDYQLGPSNDVQPQPSSQKFGTPEDANEDKKGGKGGDRGSGTAWRMFESAATTAASLAVLAIAGYTYHQWYKQLVLSKIDNAFNEGDPALNVASASHKSSDPWYSPTFRDRAHWIAMDHQEKIDSIVAGNEEGHYYLLVGEKGTGKTSMLLGAMDKTGGECCSVMEAHADAEIFRVRLGKALDFEFHEDYIGSLFSIRGPRETTALLDIERALNKLEKVAVRRRQTTGKPLVMIINGTHMIRDDQEGRDLIELLQQRAEAWAASGLVTMIFNSDDYWVYERMKGYGSRMELISISDLPRDRAIAALRKMRMNYFRQVPSDEEAEHVYQQVGGRLAFLNRVAKASDMYKKCEEINEIEKTWLLNQSGLLGQEMDDDVMDQQKFATSGMLLVQALVQMGHEMDPDPAGSHRLPQLPLHRARHVMTRADFIQQYDHLNVFTIDSHANVRADSVPMMNAFRSIASEPGFDELLEDTLERIGDIESLGRTREVTLKDLWNGGRYELDTTDWKGREERKVGVRVIRGKKGIHGDGDVLIREDADEDQAGGS